MSAAQTPPRKIPLMAWAKPRYDPVPAEFTLRRWAKTGELGEIEKVGKETYVFENAERLGAPTGTMSLVQRIKKR